MFVVLAVLSLLSLLGGITVIRRARRAATLANKITKFAASGLLLLATAILLVSLAYSYWVRHRPIPEPTQATLYEGITYTRDVRSEPRPLIIHVMQIDLNAPGIQFLVTPGQPDNGAQVLASKTSDFLETYDLQIAVNGDFYKLWPPETNPLASVSDGDPLQVVGFASSLGTVYSLGWARQPTLFISDDNQANFEEPIGDIYNAISGDVIFLRDGQLQPQATRRSYHQARNPRTAIALNETRDQMTIVVVDGRQPNYSEGVSMTELAAIVTQYGADTALNLDGGGSATLIADDSQGRALLLNSPSSSFFPGRERAVANHLGIFAAPLMQASRPANEEG